MPCGAAIKIRTVCQEGHKMSWESSQIYNQVGSVGVFCHLLPFKLANSYFSSSVIELSFLDSNTCNLSLSICLR